MEVLTPRLRLRQWRETDLPAFAALNADSRVMQSFPSTLTHEQSDALAERCHAEIAERGWGFWAVERLDTHEFIGFAGLTEPLVTMPFAPALEIGWCLAHAHWGRGYATEAATHVLGMAFEWLQVDEVVSFTSLTNNRSLAVMRRLGMQQVLERFDHPALPEDSPLRPHRLFRMGCNDWAAQAVQNSPERELMSA